MNATSCFSILRLHRDQSAAGEEVVHSSLHYPLCSFALLSISFLFSISHSYHSCLLLKKKTPNLPSTPLSVVQVAMMDINGLPAEILAEIFCHEDLAGIARQVCQHWRKIALPIWLKRLT